MMSGKTPAGYLWGALACLPLVIAAVAAISSSAVAVGMTAADPSEMAGAGRVDRTVGAAKQRPPPADPATYLADLARTLSLQWPKNRIVNIVVHGHSVPAGYFKTPAPDTFHAYPHLMHVGLKERFPYATINVIVTAVGGETSDAGSKRFENDVLSHRPDLVTIDYALNDRGIGLERTRANLVSMMEAARAKSVKVILLTPTPDQRAKLDDLNDPLNQQAELIRKLANDYGVGLVDSLAAFKAKIKEGTRLEDLMSGVNHPNAKGHEIVAAELLKWFP